MEEEFKVSFITTKEDVQTMIDTEIFAVKLEPREINVLEQALINGSDEITLTKRSEEDVRKERLGKSIELIQEMLDNVRAELDN